MTYYTQLTQAQRYQIYAMRKVGHTLLSIATETGVHKSTISRELRRNGGLRGYRSTQAHQLALNRRVNKSIVRITSTHWAEIERLILNCWRPEQIAKRLKEEQDYRISPEWIYQYVYRDKASGGSLYCYLRCQKKRKKRYGHYDKRGKMINQTMIDERPDVVDQRCRLGDWEGGTIVGRHHKGVLISLVERTSRLLILGHAPHKTKQAVGDQIINRLKPYQKKVHTCTYDNGREFADHQRIAKQLKAKMYFAHPYCSWQRGTNENTNGLIRQFFPKTRSLTKVDDAELQSVQSALNNRPRKCLNWRTPHEVFFNENKKLTVALTS